MARTKLKLPQTFVFTTQMQVRVSDVNYAGHLGNDKVLAFMHEARVRFLQSFGFTELDVEGIGTIMTDAVVVYKSEAFVGDNLAVYVATDDYGEYGCDFIYKLENQQTNREVARGKTGLVFYDYDLRKMVKTPAAFLRAVSQKPQG